MRELALLGLVALLFGAGSYYTTSGFGLFGWVNVVTGALALAAAAVLWARRARGLGSPAARRVLLPRLAWLAGALLLSFAMERAVAAAGWTFDATADRRYTISPATRNALATLPGPVTATLYSEVGDNRTRSTRLLLDTLAAAGPLTVRQRDLEHAPAEVERYGIGSSDSVVLTLGDRWELVTRPTEGTLYEGLRRLVGEQGHVVYVARGEGEGDVQRADESGYSGLAAALATEGYTVRDLVMPAVTAVPNDASVLLFVAPQRPLRDTALAALHDWLARGGRLVALLEPGAESNFTTLLESWGFGLPDAVIVDPASGPVEGDPPGVDPIAFEFGHHPATRGLDPTRMVFFRTARPVLAAHKPEPDDDLQAVVYSSRRAWLAPNAAAVQRGAPPERPAKLERNYWPIVSVGRYRRTDGPKPVETRIAVFGDAEFASNRYLRALYNLDLILNTVDWAASREDRITLRPKMLAPDQYPLTPQQSLAMLYGVGLLIPELCLAAAAWTWVRRRGA